MSDKYLCNRMQYLPFSPALGKFMFDGRIDDNRKVTPTKKATF